MTVKTWNEGFSNTLSQQPKAINQKNRRSTEAIKQNKGQVVGGDGCLVLAWVITHSFGEINTYAEISQISLTGHLAH